ARTLAAVRVGVLATAVLAALADRAGRRRLLVATSIAGCVVTALGAAAPNIVVLGVSQTIARGLTTTLVVLIAIVTVEEMPRGNRAYAASLMAMASALGSGTCVWLLPLADLGERAWRLLYLAPLVYLLLVRAVGRHLPESKRFEAPHPEAPVAGHGRRFWLLAASGFLLAVFATPASQLLAEFLRDERGFSASRLALFVLLTNTPAGLGIVLGGWIADRRGRRVVAAAGIVIGTLLVVARFGVTGWPMWVLAIAASMGAAMVVPALRVYPGELFPTSLRGGAGGLLEVVALVGSVAGLLVVGSLLDGGTSYGATFAILAAAPLAVALLIIALFPETARRELEDLNPEDRTAAATDTS
ncbi:MAG: MFS transporter, partial [Acidimicrobiales bacterium]